MRRRRSADLFLANAGAARVVTGIPDGFFPYAGAEIKDFFEKLKRMLPDLDPDPPPERSASGPSRRVELTWNTFRDSPRSSSTKFQSTTETSEPELLRGDAGRGTPEKMRHSDGVLSVASGTRAGSPRTRSSRCFDCGVSNVAHGTDTRKHFTATSFDIERRSAR